MMREFPNNEACSNAPPDPWKRVEQREALLKRLEEVFHAGMRGQPDPLQVRIDELEKQNAVYEDRLQAYQQQNSVRMEKSMAEAAERRALEDLRRAWGVQCNQR